MHISYDDITRRIVDLPIWWLNGVPRYDAFAPSKLSAYAHEAALVKVECQMCYKQFLIGCFGPSRHGEVPYRDDPPYHSSDREEYCGGNSMGYTELQILEFWNMTAWEPDADPFVVPHWRRDPSRERIFAAPMDGT
jgi:hypothetical protein